MRRYANQSKVQNTVPIEEAFPLGETLAPAPFELDLLRFFFFFWVTPAVRGTLCKRIAIHADYLSPTLLILIMSLVIDIARCRLSD
jgi:hypothetical protein